VAILALHFVLLNVNYVAKVNRLIRPVSLSSLWWAKIMKVVGNVEVPKSCLTIIVNASSNPDCWIG
jgi:hypothetical protein